MQQLEKVKKKLHMVCELLELLVAGLMIVGVILAIVGFLLSKEMFANLLREPSALTDFVARVFAIVIGIEFLQMLSRPDTDNVIEILVFLVARHMIVGESTPVHDLISIISLAILIILRWVLHDIRKRRARLEGRSPAGEEEETLIRE